MGKKFKFLSFILMIFALLVAGCQDSQPSSNGEKANATNASGGTIKVAINAQPDSLDPHLSTSTVLSDVSRNIFEPLMTLNSKYEAVPFLAESVEASKDGKVYTFHLRQGIKFHNGKEMTADDVVASMERWKKINSKAQLFEGSQFTKIDNYTVVLTLPKHTYGILEALADNGQFAGIMPKEIIENVSADGVKEYIGTGPFKYFDWKQDQYIHLQKSTDYSALETEADGLSGKREALVNDLYFYIATDNSTRVAGLQTGEYDLATELPIDNFEQIESTPNLKIDKMNGNLVMVFNKKEGLFTNKLMRQAVNTLIDNEAMLVGVQSFEEFYKLDSSYMYKEQENWYSQAGKEMYNQNDPKKALELLDEAGYNQEEIKILATRDYEWMYNAAVILKEQLENQGVKVKLDIYDWATLLEKRADSSQWDIFFTSFPAVLSPTQFLYLSADWPGWANDAKLNQYKTNINNAKTLEEAKASWEELQAYAWTDYVPAVKVGDRYSYIAYSDTLEGFTEFEGMILWNTSKK